MRCPRTSTRRRARPPDAHRTLCPGGGSDQAAPSRRTTPRRTFSRRGAQPRRGSVAARTRVRGVRHRSRLARFGALLTDVPVHVVTERAAKALSETVTPVGLVAVCSVPECSLADVLADAPRLVAVAVEISEPGNAGTLIRVADAMGADAVVLAGHSVDPYNGKCLRASAGSIFSIPVVAGPDAAGGRGACGRRPAGAGHHPRRRGQSRRRRAGRPTAWLFGSEAHGLPTEWPQRPTQRVRIPMRGSAESLNVAAAAAICLYQSARRTAWREQTRIRHTFEPTSARLAQQPRRRG